MSLLQVENMSHMFGDKSLFHHISFRLLRGEHAGLVGSNGAGKSTLLRILAGDLLPDLGRAEWLPQVKVGYLQQHTVLQEGVSVLEFLRSAFADLYEIERRMMEAAEKMAVTQGQTNDQLEYWMNRFGELQAKLDHADFYSIDTKIEEVASGLGIMALGLDRDVAKLSGGQRTKLLLGKLLLEEPDVLLLDEPTNYLDDRHIEWLTDYLQNYKHAYLVVSHDEAFLNSITNTIYHLEHQTIKRYAGNYQAFLASYELSKHQLQEAYDRQQREISRLESFIQKNRNRKAKQAKSREKALERITRIEKPGSTPKPRFQFPVHTDPVSRVITANKLEIGYMQPLFAPINLQVRRGDKIAIVGSNGIGKSTMLRTLLGLQQPLGGEVQVGDRVQAAYFAQEEAAPTATPLEQLTTNRPDLQPEVIRRTLAKSGLTEKHIRQPLCSLSGGEQAKVRLAELMLTDSNMLVLDEPTNHLDTRAKEALKEALISYQGTILLVSHEPSFYEDWVTDVWNMQDWRKR